MQEGAEKQFLSDLSALARKQGCLPVTGGWQVCLQPLLVASGFETSRQEFARYFWCWSVYLAKQAWYLLKEPAKLALSSLDVSNCCLLRELEVFGYENFACV